MGRPTPQVNACDGVDPREVFLERASARFLLVKAGAMPLDEAINGLAPAFREITGLAACACARDIIDRMESYKPRRAWGGRR